MSMSMSSSSRSYGEVSGRKNERKKETKNKQQKNSLNTWSKCTCTCWVLFSDILPVYAASGPTMSPESAAPRLANLLWRVWSGKSSSSSSHCHYRCRCRSTDNSRSRSSRLGWSPSPSPSPTISGATLARLFLRISSEAGSGTGKGKRTGGALTASSGPPQRSTSRGGGGGGGPGNGKPLPPILKNPRPVPGAVDAPKNKNQNNNKNNNKNERVSFPGCASYSPSSSCSSETAAGTEDAVSSPPRRQETHGQVQGHGGPRAVVGSSSPRKRPAFATSLASLGEEPSAQQQQQQHLDRASTTTATAGSSWQRQSHQYTMAAIPSNNIAPPLFKESETWPFEKTKTSAPLQAGSSEKSTSTAVLSPSPALTRPRTSADSGPEPESGPRNQNPHNTHDQPALVEADFRSKFVEKQKQRRDQSESGPGSHAFPSTIDNINNDTVDNGYNPRSHHQVQSARPHDTTATSTTRSTETSISATASTAPSAITIPPTSTSTSTSTSTPTPSLSSSRPAPAQSQLSRLLESERGGA